MTSITVSLTEEGLLKLQDLAARLKIPPEELARIGVEDLLALADEEFRRAMDYVLKKNAELYQRLA